MKTRLAVSGALALLVLGSAPAVAACNPLPNCALERATALAAKQIAAEQGELSGAAAIIAALAGRSRVSDQKIVEGLLARATSRKRLDALLAAVAKLSGEQVSPAALQYSARIGDPELRHRVHEEIASSYTQADRLDLAGTAIARLPAGDARDSARLNLALLHCSAGHSVETQAFAAESLSGPRQDQALAAFACSYALDGNDAAALEAIGSMTNPTLIGYTLIELTKTQIEQRRPEAALKTVQLNLERLRKGTIGGIYRDFLAEELAKQLAAAGASRAALALITEFTDVPPASLLEAIASGQILAGELDAAAETLGRLAPSEQAGTVHTWSQLARERLLSQADIAGTIRNLTAESRIEALRSAAATLSARGDDSGTRELLQYAVQAALQLPSCSADDCEEADDFLGARPFCWPADRACELSNVAIQQAQLGLVADAQVTADRVGANPHAARAWLVIADRQASTNQHRAAQRSFDRSLDLARSQRTPDALQLKVIGMYAQWIARHPEHAEALPALLAAARTLPKRVLSKCQAREALNNVVAAHAAGGLHAHAFELADTLASCDQAGAYLAIFLAC